MSRVFSRLSGRAPSDLGCIRPLLAGKRRRLTAVSMLALIGGLAEAVILVLIARLACTIAIGNGTLHGIAGVLTGLDLPVPALFTLAAVLLVVRIVAQLIQVRMWSAMTADAAAAARRAALRAFLQSSWSIQARERTGRLQELLTTYATQAGNAVASASGMVIAALNLVALLATAFVVNPAGAVAVSVTGVLVGAALRPLRALAKRCARITASSGKDLATHITEATLLIMEMRTFRVVPALLGELDRRSDEHRRAFVRAEFVRASVPGLYQGAALAIVMIMLGVIAAAGVTHLAAVGVIVLILLRSLAYGQNLQAHYQNLYATLPYVEKLAREEARLATQPAAAGTAPVPRIEALRFERVSYRYDERAPALHDVSFEIRRGGMVGIVGPSGAGKSTVVQLLLRLREPTEGRITANGVDVRQFSPDGWYRRVAVVPQEAHLFAGTVRDNIRFLRQEVSDAAIERAARLAHIHEEIVRWPDGYDTQVGQRGSDLSGGQRQRICIARALAGQPDILVLDEPTSALDAQADAVVRETLADLSCELTLIVIAHRLSTLELCSEIMVLDAGRLQGFDPPDVLARSSSFYREALRLSGVSASDDAMLPGMQPARTDPTRLFTRRVRAA